jgi:HlyD family secretion protein
VIVASNYLPGDTFSASSPVFVLDDSLKSNLQDNVQVSEADIAQVKPGEKVTVSAPSFPNATFHGTVLEVEPTPTVVNNVTEYTVLTSVNNSSGDLLPGMTTSVTIQTASASHVLMIPAVALQTVGTEEGVYIHPEFNSAKLKNNKKFTAAKKKLSGKFAQAAAKASSGVIFVPVTVGLFGSTSVQVTKGVYAGEKILLVDPASLKLPVSKGFHFGGGGGAGAHHGAFGGHGGGAAGGAGGGGAK